MFSNFYILQNLIKLTGATVDSRSISLSMPRPKLSNEAANTYDKFKFEFNEDNQNRAKALLKWYTKGEERGALLPLLDLAQRQHGWLPITAITAVANMLKLAPFEVYDVAQFYPMFHLKPRGKYVISVCTSTPCCLRGCDEILKACEEMLAIKSGETTNDMQFTLSSTYCMGACVNAPVLSINDDFYEDLTKKDIEVILCDLKANQIPPAGSRSGRNASEPKTGQTTLLIDPPPAGYMMQDLTESKKDCK